VIDLHAHILAGVDDGAATLEESLELARAAVAAGVGTLAATPHVRADYPTTPDRMEELVTSTRATLEANDVPLELLSGAEIALDELPRLEDDALARLGLGGNACLLLVEFPYEGWPLTLASTLAELRERAFTVVLAHPERNPEVQAAPARLWPLVEAGTLVQLTSASMIGRFGRDARETALELLKLELAQLVASDAHSARGRIASASEVAAALGGDEPLTQWLTHDVPDALLRSKPLPERPARRRRRLGVARFRR
jgi:protein-tyrosine phosphatase